VGQVIPKVVGLFTDFGWNGPYVGQMSAVLTAQQVAHFHLQHDCPAFDIRAGGALLLALSRNLPAKTLLIAVVDPGVGGERKAILARSEAHWFLGPDNGLLAPVITEYDAEVEEVIWRPCRLSASFHGRDLFVPAAARLVKGEHVATRPMEKAEVEGANFVESSVKVIYIDGYGNLFTNLPAAGVDVGAVVLAGGKRIAYARTFVDAPAGEPFWYSNSIGLVELAVNQGKANETLGLGLGDSIEIESPL